MLKQKNLLKTGTFILVLFFNVLISLNTLAQGTREIKGTVTDGTTNGALPNVSVSSGRT